MALYTRARIEGRARQSVLKVVDLDDFLRRDLEAGLCALLLDDSERLRQSRAVEDMRWGALISRSGAVPESHASDCVISDARDPTVLSLGNVVRVRSSGGLISSLYRRGSKNNSLLVTERCNSYCLMCSQPPIERDETGHIDELISVLRLMDRDEEILGITGGEPTLLGEELFRLFAEIRSTLPKTRLHVLTNGRRFADRDFAKMSVDAAPGATLWAIPLYTDAPEIHDFVVQRPGAFAETLKGLWNLAGLSGHVELRVVLQRAVVPRLRQLAHFVARNLSFVDHVAWMGLEPMGFAKPNWNTIWIEPEEYAEALADAVAILDRFGIATSIFNTPLCVLPPELRPYAARSISDWKNEFVADCDGCLARDKCCGFFSSAISGYLPRSLKRITEVTASNA